MAYDISDPVRLRRVHKKVKGYGDSMQYSVFVCDLTSAERAAFVLEVCKIIDRKRDRVAIVTLGDGGDDKMFWFLGDRPALPATGSMIV